MASVTAISKEQSPPAIIDIAREGDVVFIVGPTQRKLRVHSLFVKTASPVLNAMLGPNFHEGQQLATTGLAEIELPEDDADALETIFNIMHGRNDKVRDTLPLDELLQVAIAGDKYDCFASLALASRLWLGCYKDVRDPVELCALDLAACVFRKQGVFAETTAALVAYHGGSYLDLTKKYEAAMDPVMLLNIAATLEETRNQLRMKLLHDWEDRLWCKKGPHRPSWRSELGDAGNLAAKSLSDLLEISSRGEEAPAMSELADPPSRCFQMVRDSLAEKWKRNASGLCVLCLRTGEDHKLYETAQEKCQYSERSNYATFYRWLEDETYPVKVLESPSYL